MAYSDPYDIKIDFENFVHWLTQTVNEIEVIYTGIYFHPRWGRTHVRLLPSRERSSGRIFLRLGFVGGSVGNIKEPTEIITLEVEQRGKSLRIHATYANIALDYYLVLREKMNKSPFSHGPKPSENSVLPRQLHQYPNVLSGLVSPIQFPLPSGKVGSTDPSQPDGELAGEQVHVFTINLTAELLGDWLEQNTGKHWSLENTVGRDRHMRYYWLRPAELRIVASNQIRYEIRNLPASGPDFEQWIFVPRSVAPTAPVAGELAISFLLESTDNPNQLKVSSACHYPKLSDYYQSLLETIGTLWPESGLLTSDSTVIEDNRQSEGSVAQSESASSWEELGNSPLQLDQAIAKSIVDVTISEDQQLAGETRVAESRGRPRGSGTFKDANDFRNRMVAFISAYIVRQEQAPTQLAVAHHFGKTDGRVVRDWCSLYQCDWGDLVREGFATSQNNPPISS